MDDRRLNIAEMIDFLEEAQMFTEGFRLAKDKDDKGANEGKGGGIEIWDFAKNKRYVPIKKE